jgi:hypothetical protein
MRLKGKAEEKEEREDTQVTKLFKELDNKLARNRNSLRRACHTARNLEQRLSVPESRSRLKKAISSTPPPPKESSAAEG